MLVRELRVATAEDRERRALTAAIFLMLRAGDHLETALGREHPLQAEMRDMIRNLYDLAKTAHYEERSIHI